MTNILTNLWAKTLILTAIMVFAHFSQHSISAQTKKSDQKVVAAPTAEPKVFVKVSQVDDAKLKEILKPKNGKPLLVNFWATWCEPCREEFPDLVKIADDYQDKLDVITISLDDVADINTSVPQFLMGMKALMPNYLLVSEDESAVIGSISKEWSGGLPFTILYNEKGEIIYFKQGKFKTVELREKIDKIVTDKVLSDLRSTLPEYEKARIEEEENSKNDKYFYFTVGLPSEQARAWRKTLKEKYNINLVFLFCSPSSSMQTFAEGYNKFSKETLVKKFSEDVIEKANAEASEYQYNNSPKVVEIKLTVNSKVKNKP